MTNKENLRKQIIYRSMHRGSKEMDILLGTFVNKHINDFSYKDLKDLDDLLLVDDDIISSWYFKEPKNTLFKKTRVSNLLKKFKIK